MILIISYLECFFEAWIVDVLDAIVVEIVAQGYCELRSNSLGHRSHLRGDLHLCRSGIGAPFLPAPVSQHDKGQRALISCLLAIWMCHRKGESSCKRE